MTAHDLRSTAAVAAGLRGLVDPRVAATVLCGPPSWRSAAGDALLAVAGVMLVAAWWDTRVMLLCCSALTGLWIHRAEQSIREYRCERREYLDAVRAVDEARARLAGGTRG